MSIFCLYLRVVWSLCTYVCGARLWVCDGCEGGPCTPRWVGTRVTLHQTPRLATTDDTHTEERGEGGKGKEY